MLSCFLKYIQHVNRRDVDLFHLSWYGKIDQIVKQTPRYYNIKLQSAHLVISMV